MNVPPPMYYGGPPQAPPPYGQPGPSRDIRTARDGLDRVLTIVQRSLRWKWYAALVMLVGMTASLALAMLRPRQYTSETLIIYSEGIGARTIVGGDTNIDAQQKLSLKLKELVLSRTTLQRIIEEFHLYPQIVDRRGYVDAVDEMRKNIAFRAKDGDMFGLSFTGEDKVTVQKLTERLAHELIEEQSKSRLAQAGETREFLDSEKHRSDDELREKEALLAGFIAKHPEFAKESNGAGAGTQAGIATRAMSGSKGTKTSDPQLQVLEREASRLQERLGMPTKRAKVTADTDPKLVAARADAEADLKSAQHDLAEKSEKLTEEHPDVRAAKIKLKAAEQKLRRANDAIAANDAELKNKPEPVDEGSINRPALEAELKKVQEAVAARRRRIAEGASPAENSAAASSASSIVQLETDWTRLNREVTDARERNQQLESRQFKAAIMENAVTSARSAQMTIHDPAYLPSHPNKGRTQVVIAGVAVSVVLSLLVALLLTILDDRIYDRLDLEGLRLAPLLGVIPRADGKKDNRG